MFIRDKHSYNDVFITAQPCLFAVMNAVYERARLVPVIMKCIPGQLSNRSDPAIERTLYRASKNQTSRDYHGSNILRLLKNS